MVMMLHVQITHISIGVTGLTVNSGLTTFPTIQRKSYDNLGERGHRNSGSIKRYNLMQKPL